MDNKDKQQQALALVREALGRYTDVPAEKIVPEAVLADLQIDSLTVAELFFELEDKLGKALPETGTLPATVGELVAIVAAQLPD